METFSALLAICAGNSPVLGEFPPQRPVTRSFFVYFDLRPDKRLSKQSWGWWFETLPHSLWRHRNVTSSVEKVVSTVFVEAGWIVTISMDADNLPGHMCSIRFHRTFTSRFSHLKFLDQSSDVSNIKILLLVTLCLGLSNEVTTENAHHVYRQFKMRILAFRLFARTHINTQIKIHIYQRTLCVSN